MTKKVFMLLLFLSTVTLANTPTRHHRVRMTEPDALAAQAAVQEQLSSMLTPSFPAERSTTASDVVTATIVRDLIAAAKRHIGARYRIGASGPSAFDCSGFTSYVFDKLGISLKRSSREQNTQGTLIDDVRSLQPGDLVFFGRGGRRGTIVNHVGIVTTVDAADGTFEFIHSSTSRGVRVDKYPDVAYWENHFVNGRRIIGTDELSSDPA